jgi:hypothetical protein
MYLRVGEIVYTHELSMEQLCVLNVGVEAAFTQEFSATPLHMCTTYVNKFTGTHNKFC